MADMQAGIGPFLGVYLLAHGWESGLIGTVMTIGGIAGMIMTTPAGALNAARFSKYLPPGPGREIGACAGFSKSARWFIIWPVFS